MAANSGPGAQKIQEPAQKGANSDTPRMPDSNGAAINAKMNRKPRSLFGSSTQKSQNPEKAAANLGSSTQQSQNPEKAAANLGAAVQVPAQRRANMVDQDYIRNIVMLGKTGAGKSSLGNAILKTCKDDNLTTFPVFHGMYSSPISTPLEKTFKYENLWFKLVDAPGFHSNFTSRKEGLWNICSIVAKCPAGVDAFFIVIRLNARFTEEDSCAIDEFAYLFGEKFWDYVLPIYTHADEFGNDQRVCQSFLEKAHANLPVLKRLHSKQEFPPIIVDTRRGPDSSSCQNKFSSILWMVDIMVHKNDGTKLSSNLKMDAPLAMLIEEKNDKLRRNIEELRRNEEKSIRQKEAVGNMSMITKCNKKLEQEIAEMEAFLAERMMTDAKSESSCRFL